MEAEEKIKLSSSEGKEFAITVAAAKGSKVIDGMLQDYPDQAIPLPEVKTVTLERVIAYLEHYKGGMPEEIPKPLIDSNIQRIIPAFDFEFIKDLSLSDCYDLINAANYLDIPSLLNLGCAFVASKLYDEDTNSIREKLGIESDMTEDEKKEYEKYSLE